MSAAAKKKRTAKRAAPKSFADHHFGIWTHSQGHKVAAYARHSENFGGYVVFDAQTGRRISGDRVFPSVAAVAERAPFTLNASGVINPTLADKPQ